MKPIFIILLIIKIPKIRNNITYVYIIILINIANVIVIVTMNIKSIFKLALQTILRIMPILWRLLNNMFYDIFVGCMCLLILLST